MEWQEYNDLLLSQSVHGVVNDEDLVSTLDDIDMILADKGTLNIEVIWREDR